MRSACFCWVGPSRHVRPEKVCERFHFLNPPAPADITGLPSEVLATPFGAMIGQMMTGMQQSMGAHMHDPFAAIATVPPPVLPPVSSTLPYRFVFSQQNDGRCCVSVCPAVAPPAVPAPRSLTKPLLSTASEALPAVAARLIKLGSATDSTPALFLPEDAAVLVTAGDALKAALGNDVPSFAFGPACDIIKRVLETWSPQALAQAYFPALCMLRVLVLQESAVEFWTTTGDLLSPLQLPTCFESSSFVCMCACFQAPPCLIRCFTLPCRACQ